MSENNARIQQDEITLKELILKIREFWFELWKFWWLIGLICVPFVFFKAYKAITSEKIYPAELTFMVNSDDGSSLSAFSGILGTFGIGGGTAKGEYNLDKMLQLLKSRKITEQVLFTTVDIEGNNAFLGNHVINHLDTLDKWVRKPSLLNRKEDKLKDFEFTHGKVEEFELLENTAVKRLKGRIIGTSEKAGFLTSGYNEDSGILNMKFETEHEELSIQLARIYYDKLSSYYTDKTIEKQQVTYDLVKSKSDSIYSLLNDTEYRLASLIESTRGVYLEREQLNKTKLEREVQKLNIMYAESAKNLEIADFTLKSKTPFVQLIDEPVSPIKPESESLLMGLIMGGLLGVFVGISFVIARKIYRDTMSGE